MYDKYAAVNDAVKNFQADTELIRELKQAGVPQYSFSTSTLIEIGKDVEDAIKKQLIKNEFNPDILDEILCYPLMEGVIRSGLFIWCTKHCNDEALKDKCKILFQDKIELINMFIVARLDSIKREQKIQDFKNRNNKKDETK